MERINLKKPPPPKKIFYFFFGIIFTCLLLINFAIYFISHHDFPLLYLVAGLTLLTLLVFCIAFVFVQLHLKHAQQQEEATRELNEMLTYEMQELGIRNEKMELLIELSEIVQACITIEEVTHAIGFKCGRILHFAEGIIYIMNSKTNLLAASVTWGQPRPYEENITPEQCWALRKGTFYQVNNPETDLICEHVLKDHITPYICIPLTAQNSIFGLLHLEFSDTYMALHEADRIFISAISEILALALSNIQLREKLYDQSLHDSLTGLYNKRYLSEFLLKEVTLAKRHQMNLAIMMIDIDYFKEFNDHYGHEAGDLILRTLGNFFLNAVRTGDFTCRYGGEEFLCLLHHCDLTNAKKRGENFRSKIENITIEFNNQPLKQVTISVGIAIFPEDGQTPSELIIAADQALYHAKKMGRNRVVAFSEI